ncbi:hypothetical protein D9M68_486680 [compost metagenome]
MVDAGARDVDLVAALRAVLRHPEAAVGGERRALAVAMAVAPYLGQRARLADEGVVFRHAAVLGDAHHLAVVVVERLRIVLAAEAVAEREEQVAVAGFDDAAAEVRAARDLGLLAEDDLQRFQLRAIGRQAGACKRGAVGRSARRLGLRIAEVQGAILREAAVGQHVEQPALPARRDGRQALDGRAQLAIRRHKAQAAGLLGDHETALRQEGDAPGVLKTGRDGFGSHLRHGRACEATTHEHHQASEGAKKGAISQVHEAFLNLRTSWQPMECTCRLLRLQSHISRGVYIRILMPHKRSPLHFFFRRIEKVHVNQWFTREFNNSD